MKNKKGFTLIELVVVIVILGILAVTAAPKFLNIQRDARIASLNGVKGALESSFSMFAMKSQLPSANIISVTDDIRILLLNDRDGIRISNFDNYPFFSYFNIGNELAGIDAIKQLANIDVYSIDYDGSAKNKLNIEFNTNQYGDFRIFPPLDNYDEDNGKTKCYLQYNTNKTAKSHFTLYTTDC